MAKTPYVRAILLSFYDRALYQEASQRWTGLGFKYLALVLLFCTVLTTLNTTRDIFMALKPYASQLPSFQIKDGSFRTDIPTPLVLNDPISERPAFIVDTTGKYKNLDHDTADVLITPNEFYYRESARTVHRLSFAYFPDMLVNPSNAGKFLKKFVFCSPRFCFRFVFGSFCFPALEIFFYATLGLIFASQKQLTLTLPSLLRMSALANTPAILLSTLLCTLQIFDPWKLLLQGNVQFSWIDLWFVPLLFLGILPSLLVCSRRDFRRRRRHRLIEP